MERDFNDADADQRAADEGDAWITLGELCFEQDAHLNVVTGAELHGCNPAADGDRLTAVQQRAAPPPPEETPP